MEIQTWALPTFLIILLTLLIVVIVIYVYYLGQIKFCSNQASPYCLNLICPQGNPPVNQSNQLCQGYASRIDSDGVTQCALTGFYSS